METEKTKEWQRVYMTARGIVAEIGGRSLNNWKGGYYIILRDGRPMLSNSPDFRAALNAEYRKVYGVEPNFGSVTYALARLNSAGFRNKKFL